MIWSISNGNLVKRSTSVRRSLCFNVFFAFMVLTMAASTWYFLSCNTLSWILSESYLVSFFWMELIWILLIFDLKFLFTENLSSLEIVFLNDLALDITRGVSSAAGFTTCTDAFSSCKSKSLCSSIDNEMSCFLSSGASSSVTSWSYSNVMNGLLTSSSLKAKRITAWVPLKSNNLVVLALILASIRHVHI